MKSRYAEQTINGGADPRRPSPAVRECMSMALEPAANYRHLLSVETRRALEERERAKSQGSGSVAS